jgi:ABC-type glycerol-3-phosphate transport system substrate-binding protein
MEQMDKAAFWLPTRNDLVSKGVKYATRSADMSVFQADAANTPAATYGIQSIPTVAPAIYNNLRDLMSEVIAGKKTAKQAIADQISFIDATLATLKK